MMKRLALILTLCLLLARVAGADELAQNFAAPPESARPWTFWWWLKGNVSREGITRDLEEMKKQGIGGVLIFQAGGEAGPMPDGVQFFSPEWRVLFRHALGEAKRLGLDVSMNLCDGWDCGGPWIGPEEANKKLVRAEVQLEGGRRIEQLLPAPPTVDGYYRDTAVVAFRERPGTAVRPAEVTASSSAGGYCGELNQPPLDAVDGDPETYWSAANGAPAWLNLRYHEPLAVTSVSVAPTAADGPLECELQQVTGGTTFTTVCRFTLDPGQAKKVDFAPVTAAEFRLLVNPAQGKPVQMAEVTLLRAGDEPRLRRGIKWWAFKSGNRSFWDWPRQGPAALGEEYPGPDDAPDCQAGEVVDLTSMMDAQGRLAWDAPAGRWTVQRWGYTLLGQRTRCGVLTGYETDMLSSAGIEAQFKHVAEPLLEDSAATGNPLKNFHIDSYELGADVQGQQPTWSPAFREEFRARRGYDLLPYLPALGRRVVGSRAETDRFLWDVRRTIGDLMAERFWKRFGELAHARGVGVHMETGYGTYPYPHIDGLQCAGQSDIPMGEFWHGTDIMSQFSPWGDVIRTVASAAHTYGHPLVQAESFTSWQHWQEDPFSLKPVGDDAFCAGLNRMVFHQYTHQPQLDFKPGWQYGAGTHFDRNITWWQQSHAFFGYLARCQSLLQQGRFVADAAYYYGEGATSFVPGKKYLRPALPAGYDCDTIDADILLNRLSVRDGRLALPDGMSYRLLVLREDAALSPPVLRKIKELINEGATVVAGPRPRTAPGLKGYPGCDVELAKLADELWGVDAGTSATATMTTTTTTTASTTVSVSATERRLGKGRLVLGRTPGEVLLADGVPADFEVTGKPDVGLNYIHRTIGDAEIYFVANPQDQGVALPCAFRVSGRQPELWDPVSGAMRDATAFTQTGGSGSGRPRSAGRTIIPLEFAPHGSMFVVFRRPIAPDTAGTATSNFPTLVAAQELAGPWTVRFDQAWGGPASVTFEQLTDWTGRPEAGIKNYSGTARYEKTFDWPADTAKTRAKVYLDLGELHNLAEVRLNGQSLGVLWTKPFRVEITDQVKAAGNVLEVDVINLWPNRVIGDAALPVAQRLTKTNVALSKDQPLLPSGLLGPVKLLTGQ